MENDTQTVRFELGQQQFLVRQDPVPHVIIDRVFGPDGSRRILDHLISLKQHYQPAVVGPNLEIDPEFRTNLVFSPDGHFHDPEQQDDWQQRIRYRAMNSDLLAGVDSLFIHPELKDVLDSAPWPLCKFREANRWETQVSRYGGKGEKYNWHIDRIGEDTRIVTIIYYVFSDPKRFSGGELELTNALVRRGALISEGDVSRIDVVNDRAILIPARAVHRVLPTKSPDEWSAGRFSVNVFAGRGEAPPPLQHF